MNFLQKLRNKFYNHYLNKSLSQTRVMRLSTNLEEANTVGILFNAFDESQIQVVLNYADRLSANGKTISLLGYYDTKEIIEHDDFPHFNKKNIDWANRPEGEKVTQFMSESFDLLINLSGKTNPPFDYIMALSKASFRVGPPTENTYSCDLMIDTKNPEDIANFIKQAESFLNKMTTHHEPIPA